MNHSLFEVDNGNYRCTCGQPFAGAFAALDHALPLNTRALAEKVAADRTSSPELISRTAALADDAAQICGPHTDDWAAQ